MKKVIVPVELDEANAFVAEHHRHHKEVQGHKFSLGLSVNGTIGAVIIVGRPVSRMLDDGWTLEATRCCSNGSQPYSCSCLYAAAWRAARALGYRRLITYTLETERGVSLTAAGFKCIGKTSGGSWDRVCRPRIDKHPTQRKMRWEMEAAL